ncbi:hypothetical protein [Nonomuraea africana]
MEPDGTRSFAGELTVDVKGGPGTVQITYWATDNGDIVADTATCTRIGCA